MLVVSKARIYLTEDRKSAVPEGDPKAKFLLVAQGQEISAETLAKYEDATDLANGIRKTGYVDPPAQPITPEPPALPPEPAPYAPAEQPASTEAGPPAEHRRGPGRPRRDQ